MISQKKTNAYAVLMNGPRVYEQEKTDRFRDYDIVYFVNDFFIWYISMKNDFVVSEGRILEKV